MKFIRSFSFHLRFYKILGVIVGIYVLSYTYPFFYAVGDISLYTLILLSILDLLFTYSNGSIIATRETSDKFSNGDFNDVALHISNKYSREMYLDIYDEIPFQFQNREEFISEIVQAKSEKLINYKLRPVTRGEYQFGNINIYCSSILKLITKRYVFEQTQTIAVYPSFINMQQYELAAFTKRSQTGLKLMRRLGHSREFEQINHYVLGNDIRTINWKATARRNELMVNHYQDETSQNIYSVIDMSRNMQLPFNGLTLLDYAINTALVISNITIKKYDKAGLLTFSNELHTILPADKHMKQIHKIMEALYNQKTDFKEADFEMLYAKTSQLFQGRSLLFLYTNFQQMSQMERQLKSLRAMNKRHLLVVVIFENVELEEFSKGHSKSTEEIYQRAIANQYIMEKEQIVRELNHNGIHTILTKPDELSINAINKYIELKSIGLI